MRKLFFNKLWTKLLSMVLLFSFLQLIACGTIMYPERKGQKAGRLDPAIVVLDAIGLLFFIIPGVIAFAVDFNNGAIYLPGGNSKQGKLQDVKVVTFDPSTKSPYNLARLIKDNTGKKIEFNEENMIVYESDGTQDPRAFVLSTNRF
jgi:hypothetical protein